MFSKVFFAVCFSVLSVTAMSQTKNPFFYEEISNDSKSTNFVFGFYPSSYQYIEDPKVQAYATIKSAVINNSADSLKWNNYKLLILLKSGKLIRSYTTVAESGDYACNYTVTGSTTHYQYYCFHSKFIKEDIDKVWLVMGDDQIFPLIYDKNE